MNAIAEILQRRSDIVKPASATPLSCLLLAEAVAEAQLPAGVFQVVVGAAAEIAAEFQENPICRKISFTGSTEVGRQLIAGAAETVAQLSLELGGHVPVLVFDDADIEQARSLSARVLCGGKRWEACPQENFLEPTVLAEVPPDALCMREETFAPILPVAPFDDEDQAIDHANDTSYGLAAYAFTRDLSRMWRLAENIEAGTIGINHISIGVDA